jgi:predicted PurR-regulated permease PerM
MEILLPSAPQFSLFSSGVSIPTGTVSLTGPKQLARTLANGRGSPFRVASPPIRRRLQSKKHRRTFDAMKLRIILSVWKENGRFVQSASEAPGKSKRADGALLTCILVLAVLYFGREVFIPLALAGLLAFLLAPVAGFFEKWGIGRTPSTLLVIVVAAIGAAALGWVMLGQIYNLAVELPQYRENVTEKIDTLHLNSAGRLSSTVDMLSSISKQISTGGPSALPLLPATAPHRTRDKPAANKSIGSDQEKGQPVSVRVEQPEESMLAMAETSIVPLIHPMTTSFIVVVFLIFILLGREDLRDRGLRLAGNEQLHVTTLAIGDASRRVSKYLQMQLITNLCYGSVVGVGLWLIGIPHPLLWAVLFVFCALCLM